MLELLNNQTWLLITATITLGLCVGSFLNVVILRFPRRLQHDWRSQCQALLELPVDESPPPDLVFKASHCLNCKTAIKPWDNIPLLSFLLLKGRCRKCEQSIGWRYPLIELLTASLTLFVVMHLGLSWYMLMVLILTWMLLAASVIDLEHQLLPDQFTLPLLWLGLIVSVSGWSQVIPVDAIIGAAAGYLSLWLVFHIFRLLTGKEGMGYGDFKLLAALGAWLGWQLLPVVILFSALVGALIGIGLIIFGKNKRSQPIPFGPFLAAAGWLALFWGQDLMNWYLSI